jgi:hypothetical protein
MCWGQPGLAFSVPLSRTTFTGPERLSLVVPSVSSCKNLFHVFSVFRG